MLRFLRSELFRLRRRRMTLVLLLLMAVIPLLLYVVLYSSAQSALQQIRAGTPPANPGQTEESVRALLETLRPDNAPSFGLGVVTAVGTIFAIILAGSVTGNEFGWATIRTVLAHGGRRGAFLVAKLIALAIVAVVLVVVGFAATFAGSYGVSVLGGTDPALGADLPGRTLGSMARSFYVALPYIALAALMAVVARSAASGIAFGLVISFGESLVADLAVVLVPDLRPLFDAGISRNVDVITRVPQGPGTSPQPMSDVALSGFILAMYAVAFIALAAYRLSKRDVTLA